MPDVCLQEVKFILNPVLPFRHFFWNLTRLGLCELAVTCPLQIKPGLAHFDRQLMTNSNSNSTFIALNLYLLTDSKTHKAKNQRS